MPDHTMTPDQRYCFDTSGFLHLEGVLQGAELQTAQETVQRYVDTPTEDLPPGFQAANGNYSHGFAFDKALEALTVHPRTWPIVKELTDGKPRFASGTMRVNTHAQNLFGPLHSARDDWGPQTPRYIAEGGRIYCDYFVVFLLLYALLCFTSRKSASTWSAIASPCPASMPLARPMYLSS